MGKCPKLLSLAAAIVLLFTSLFTACSLQTQSKSSSSQALKRPVTLKHYLLMDETAMKVAKIPEMVEEFQKQNPDIKIDIQPFVRSTSADEYTKKQRIMIASGEQMDVLYIKDIQTLAGIVSAGLAEPLDELAQKAGTDIKADYRGVVPFNGRIYALPTQYSTWVTFINKDLLDKAKLPLPPADWTWDDYREYARRMTFGEGKDKIYGSYMHTWEWFIAVGAQNKIKDNPYFKKDGSANFDDPVFKNGMQFRHELEAVDKSQIPFIDIVTQKMVYRSVFFSGKAAMMPQGTWMLVDIKNKEKYPHTFKTVFATYPRADRDSPVNFSNNGGAGCGYGINEQSKFKLETFRYITFLSSAGVDIAKGTLTPWKKGNSEAIVKELMGTDESLYDMASLKKILDDPNKKDNDYTYSPDYGTDVSSIYLDESEKYFVGGQDLEETINHLQNRVNAIIARNKK